MKPILKIQYTETALEDLKRLPAKTADQILKKTERLKPRPIGDIKRLTAFDYDYRLRAGDYRILFDIDGQTLIIHRILNRKEAYD